MALLLGADTNNDLIPADLAFKNYIHNPGHVGASLSGILPPLPQVCLLIFWYWMVPAADGI